MTDEQGALIAESLDLTKRFILALAVDAAGQSWLWIVDATAEHSEQCAPWPAHETLGLLPAEYVAAVARALRRCHHPTATGAPCRRRVTTPGPCTDHTGQRHA